MSSSPHERNICFTIKNTGRFTKTTLNLKAGEEVIVDGPFGIFALKDNGKDSVFIAGGVGITPFFSMIKDNLFKEKKRDILLIYGSKTKEDIPNIFTLADKKSSENLFIERWYQLLKPKGRLGAVLPESVFDTGENLYIRLFLYKHFWVKAIVSLPTVTFEPYTTTKTSLLFAQKKTAEEIKEYDEIWSKHSKRFEQLEKDLKLLIKKGEEEKNTTKQFKDDLAKLIKEYIREEFESRDEELTFADLVKKYKVFFEKGTSFKITQANIKEFLPQ